MTTTVTLGRDSYHLNPEIYTWCEEMFDADTWKLASMMFGHQVFHFADSADAAFFMLKWGGTLTNENGKALQQI